MLNIQNLKPKGFQRTRKVNGEKTIEFTAIPTGDNKEHFDLVVEESSVNALDDNYIIKKLTENSRGKRYVKQATGIHDFYVNMINKQQSDIHNGSITFFDYMNMVFEGTGYNFVAVDTFNARSFENLGNDNRLALLQLGLERFQAEFELVGNEVRFYEQIGNDTDFQFRYGHNVKAISREIDTTNLATVIHGTGDRELGIEAYYRSPNADIYGELEAPPVDDERFTSEETLLEEMKARLIDAPQITITVDFVDLRAAGYPYTVPNEGDRVWLIYEPMDDLLIETRILEIVEYFDVDMNPIRTEVTLSNHKKSFAGTMYDNVQKQLSEIVDDDGVVKDSVIPEAVKIATEALQRAQTELIFDNGIIARDSNDPNRMVVYNSEGIGITDDGGETFREAITADGFVLSAGVIGQLSANNIQVGPGTHFEEGFDPSEKVSGDEVPEHLNKGSLTDAENDNWDELTEPGNYAVSYEADGARPQGYPEGAWQNGMLQISYAGNNYIVQKYEMYSSLRSSYRRFGYYYHEENEVNWNDWQQEETTRGSRETAEEVRNVWAYEDTTYIDGGNIYTNTVNANVLRGGTVIANDIIFEGTLRGVDGTFLGKINSFNDYYGVANSAAEISDGYIAGLNLSYDTAKNSVFLYEEGSLSITTSNYRPENIDKDDVRGDVDRALEQKVQSLEFGGNLIRLSDYSEDTTASLNLTSTNFSVFSSTELILDAINDIRLSSFGIIRAESDFAASSDVILDRSAIPSFTGSSNLRLSTSDPTRESRIGILSSKRELKRDIETLKITKEELFSLNPVKFKSKEEVDEKGFDDSPFYIGFIAEEVAESKIPELADFDPEGNPVNVNYDRVAAASLPVLKEHDGKIEEIITRLEKLERSAQ